MDLLDKKIKEAWKRYDNDALSMRLFGYIPLTEFEREYFAL